MLGPMSYAIEVSCAGVPGTETFEFDDLPIRIGRSDLNDLVLDVPFVSQCHAVVRDVEGTPSYTDLGSTNSTLHNGQPLSRRVTIPLTAGAVLTVAQISLKWVGLSDGKPEAGATAERKVFRLRPPPSAMAPEYPTPETVVFSPLSWSPPIPEERSPGIPAVKAPAPPSPTSEPDRVQTQHMPGVEWTLGERAPLTRLIARSTSGLPLMPAGEVGPADVPLSRGKKPGRLPWMKLVNRLSRLANSIPAAEDRILFLRVFDVLEVSIQSLVSLRDGQLAAADELGVRARVDATSPLRKGQKATDILTYLLAGEDAAKREPANGHDELAGFYADALFQQIALMNAVREGVDALITRLDPSGSFAEEGRGRLLGGATLKKYETFFRESTEDPWSTVFGREFAGAYAASMDATAGLHPAPASSSLAQHLADRPRLTVTSAELNGQQILLPQAGGTIGRTEDNDIVLAHASVSRRHARVFREKDRWVIEDAGSSNGLTVNGERCDRTVLKAGDVLQLGKVTLRFDDDGAS